ncbi:MAG: hypothetical protein U9Q23_00970 [Candidatus Bipolaricaulota bacterium]|nr:hypothetical protein [Candidatus Bipolaricaulota bacterium]
MMNRKIPFIKGQMGGNEIVLLDGKSIPTKDRLEIGLTVLDPPSIRGHQAALLYGDGVNRLRAEIISVSGRGFISSCGGLTQVLGKALVDTDISNRFKLGLDEPITAVELETEAGLVPIISEGQRIISVMTAFVEECYGLGVVPMQVAGVNVWRVGKVLVVDGAELREAYPEVTLDRFDDRTKTVLSRLQDDFHAAAFPGRDVGDFAVYDFRPAHSGDGRVIFPHKISAGHIEPSCGTGTVAVGIAIAEGGTPNPDQRELRLRFESGGDGSGIGGPDITEIWLTTDDNKRVMQVRFTHSDVDIIATGHAWTQTRKQSAKED